MGEIYRDGIRYSGGGDYREQDNLPSINGNTLIGDKNAVNLGIINDTTASSNSTYSSNKIDSEVAGEEIAASVSGASIAIADSADANVQGLEVYGRSRKSKNIIVGFESGAVSDNGGDTPYLARIRTPNNNKITVDATKSYTLNAIATATGATAEGAVYQYAADNSYIGSIGWFTLPHTVTLSSNCTKIRVALRYSDNSDITTDSFANIQLEEGSTATPYEPYGIISIGDSGSLAITTSNSDSTKTSTASITTALPYCGIPVTSNETYTDEQGQKWLSDEMTVDGVVKRCYKITFDGSSDEAWAIDSASTSTTDGSKRATMNYLTPAAKALVSTSNVPEIICGSLSINSPSNIWNGSAINAIAVNTQQVHVRVYGISTVEDIKTYLASNPVTVVYELATPTTSQLTSAEKSALLSLKTYDSTTNLSVTDGPYVDFSYLKNTQNGKAIAQLSENLMSMLSGGTPTFSFARAIYDAGDTVTATDGTTTLTSDASGDYVFAIPNSGTWTFSDGTTTISKSLTTYGETAKCNLISLLPASVEKNILAEIRAGHFNLGEDVGEGFKATNSNTFSLAEDGSLITSATGHVYYDLVNTNQPATIYFVGKCPDDTTITRVFARHHSNSAGESPGFYTESNKILNATYYGSNTPTSISKTSLFVCAMTFSYIGSTKTANYYANNTFTTNKAPVNAGRYCYFSGTSVTANTPTDTTEYGDTVTISYIGIVNGAEDSTTIQTNIAAIMTAFGIS